MSTPIKLFNLDVHISVIQDIKYIFNDIYGKNIDITNWSISGHSWVFNMNTSRVDVINGYTWRFMGPDMIMKFNNVYRDFLKQFDGFIVTHTPVFCLLYEEYRKPIFLINSCRYEQPYSCHYEQPPCRKSDLEKWAWLNNGLQRLHANGQLIAVSNNKADQEYLRRGTGLYSTLIPSLCLYTGVTYTPTRPEFVVYGDRSFFPPCDILIEKPASGYTWRELYSYRGVVHIPYEMSTMILFEQYTAGVPLFLPSRDYYRECIMNKTMTFGSIYAKNGPDTLTEALTSIDFWLSRADYYDDDNFKFIRFYTSPANLIQQLLAFSITPEEQAERALWLGLRKETVYKSWKSLCSQYILNL